MHDYTYCVRSWALLVNFCVPFCGWSTYAQNIKKYIFIYCTAVVLYNNLYLKFVNTIDICTPKNGFDLAGYVAHTCNPATGRLDRVAGSRPGVLLDRRLRRTGVRTKSSIDMVQSEESGGSRLSKEERTGPGGKPSSQKFPYWAVVGSRQWVGNV